MTPNNALEVEAAARQMRQTHVSRAGSWPAGMLMMAALLLLAGASFAQSAADVGLNTTAAVLEIAPAERLYDGTVEAVNSATVSAQTAGRIAEVYYDVDDYVEAGAPVIRFTNVEQTASARQAEAQLQEALARETEASDEYERIRNLYGSNAVSKRDLDRALTARDAAVARVAAARSALESAREQVEYTIVRAPYAGIVTERHVEVGESVSVGRPLMSGLSLEALRVKVEVPQQIVGRIRESMKASVLTDEGRVTPTSITIFPYADQSTNTFTVRLELPEGQFSLYPGMFTKVAFVVGEAQRLLVPTSAIVRRSEVTGIYVVNDDKSIRLRQIRIGAEFGERTEVLAGLLPDENVATDPVSAGIYVKSASSADHGS